MFTKWNAHNILIKKGGSVMFETNKLRGRIIEKFGSQTAFCSAVGNCTSHVSSYLKGKTTLSQDTIAKWAAALDIPSDELDAYFFTPIVHEMEQ